MEYLQDTPARLMFGSGILISSNGPMTVHIFQFIKYVLYALFCSTFPITQPYRMAILVPFRWTDKAVRLREVRSFIQGVRPAPG